MNRQLFKGISSVLVAAPSEPVELLIGDGTNNQYYTPVNGYYDYSQYGAIIQTSQLGQASGNLLQAIEFRFKGWTSGYTMPNQTIKLGHISESVWANSSPYPSIDYSNYTVSDLTSVKSNFTVVIQNDWVRINFDTPFAHNGSDNLLISWENRDGDWDSGYGGSWNTSTSGLQMCRWERDGSYPSGTTTTRSYFHPTVKLTFQN
jgi:hypothetical protein